MPGRARAREGFNIWPGFVDALSTLLIMLLFVLTVFTAMQVFLGDVLTGRDKTITQLSSQKEQLAKQLAEETALMEQAQRDIAGLRDRLGATIAQREGLERERASLQSRLAGLEREKSALEAEKADAERRIAGLESEKSALQSQKAEAERKIAALEGEKSTLQSQKSDAERRIATLDKEKTDLIARVTGLDREKLAALARIAALERRSADDRLAAETDRSRSAAEKSELERRLESLEAQRGAEEAEKRRLAVDKSDLERRLAALEAQRRAEEAEKTRIAGEKTDLERRLEALEARRRAEEDAGRRLAAEKQSVEQRLAQLERDLDALRRERDRLQAALLVEEKTVGDQQRLTDTQAAEIALLNRQMAALRSQLGAIEEALKAAEAKSTTQKVEIEDLGRRLNLALASQVQELQRYRSEFFGRLREILGDRPDIRVVGDRFVFQSEVLFPVGSDEINPAGREQLAKLARTLKEISAKVPRELNWVLRVDGHTDRRPIVSARFPSNWELSSARAIAVVKLLMAEGVPANRLVAAGFGEFQPLEPGEGEESFGKNRRIELKLTER
jgi:chemotaxis protein MotB